MAKHPVNLLARFLLELLALAALGYWGYAAHDGAWRWLLMVAAPVIAAAAWGIFRVPDDPGPAPVRLSGIGRLLLEAIFFGAAISALFAAGQPTFGTWFAAAVLVHYALSWDRIAWLIRQ